MASNLKSAAVTLRHVAEEAGVSIRTVTRMLKNEPGGNPETYARVRKIADRLGYVPNVAARNLKIRSSNMVGLVTSAGGNEMRIRIRIALQKRLEGAGKYFISGMIERGGEKLERMLRDWSGLARDVVFLTWPHELNPAEILTGLPMRFIFVDCLDDRARDVVLIDRVAGVRAGAQLLIKTGHRRIARCGPDMPTRRMGFNAAFEDKAGAGVIKCEITTSGIGPKEGYDAGPAIMKKAVDAVFFETDSLALGFYKYAHERGIRIPDDIAVVGFNDNPAGLYACPALSSVALPIEAMAGEVCDMIVKPQKKPRKVTFPARFVRRESV
ncbi:MAG: LacI family DNA-binding transcriptional regulator [Kiritimatiellia bacterium]